MGVLVALTDSDEALTLRLSDARKLDLRVSEDVLFPILRLGRVDGSIIGLYKAKAFLAEGVSAVQMHPWTRLYVIARFVFW